MTKPGKEVGGEVTEDTKPLLLRDVSSPVLVVLAAIHLGNALLFLLLSWRGGLAMAGVVGAAGLWARYRRRRGSRGDLQEAPGAFA